MNNTGYTLIVDEIPGLIVGDRDNPPGRVVLLDDAGNSSWETSVLKMPYDIAMCADGTFLVNLIRERAVWHITGGGEVLGVRKVGGYPCSLQQLAGDHILVAGWDDDVPGFVREFDGAGKVVWSLENLRWPWKAQRLADGNTLIADAGTGHVYEVNAAGATVWAVEGLGPSQPQLFDGLGPVYCQRLENGNTLVSVRALSRVVELDRSGQPVWEVGPGLVLNQYSAERLANGNTLIADQGHNRVIEIDMRRTIVWERGGFGYPAKAYRL